MELELKVATPETAAVELPVNVPLFGLLAILSVTVLASEATVFPLASCTRTVIAGVIELPAWVFEGETLNAN